MQHPKMAECAATPNQLPRPVQEPATCHQSQPKPHPPTATNMLLQTLPAASVEHLLCRLQSGTSTAKFAVWLAWGARSLPSTECRPLVLHTCNLFECETGRAVVTAVVHEVVYYVLDLITLAGVNSRARGGRRLRLACCRHSSTTTESRNTWHVR